MICSIDLQVAVGEPAYQDELTGGLKEGSLAHASATTPYLPS